MGDVAKPPRGLLSLHPSPNPPKAALLMFHSLFYLFPLFFPFKLRDVEWVQSVSGVMKVCFTCPPSLYLFRSAVNTPR